MWNGARRAETAADHEFIEQPMASWAQGYLAAARLYGHGIDDRRGMEAVTGVAGWLDKWCAAHPDELLESAMKALVDELVTSGPNWVPPTTAPMPARTLHK